MREKEGRKFSICEEEISREFNKRAHLWDNQTKATKKFRQAYLKLVSKIISYSKLNGDCIILDIGTGTGALALPMAKKAKKVIGIDISKKMLEVARNKATKNGILNVDFKPGGFLDPNVSENSVDIIVSSLAMHHLPKPKKIEAINLMKDILKKDGTVVLGDVMLFFDPERDKEKLNYTIKFAKEYFSSVSRESKISLKHEYPSKKDDLISFFKQAGFYIETAEEILPFMGVICARKKN